MMVEVEEEVKQQWRTNGRSEWTNIEVKANKTAARKIKERLSAEQLQSEEMKWKPTTIQVICLNQARQRRRRRRQTQQQQQKEQRQPRIITTNWLKMLGSSSSIITADRKKLLFILKESNVMQRKYCKQSIYFVNLGGLKEGSKQKVRTAQKRNRVKEEAVQPAQRSSFSIFCRQFPHKLREKQQNM